MMNDVDSRMEQISRISPIPENEKVLREELQLLYMLVDSIKRENPTGSQAMEETVNNFAESRISEMENIKFMNIKELPKRKCDLNSFLLKTLKKLDKKGRRISFYSKTEEISVLINEKAIAALFERLTVFCKNRMSVEIKENRIKIKSDCSFSELIEVRNGKSDLMLVINKILSFHSSSIFLSSQKTGCEISLSLDGMLCDKTDKC